MRNWKKVKLRELKNSPALLKEFYQDYEAIFGMACKSCESKLNSYFIELTNNTKKMSSERKCQLSKRTILFVDGQRFTNNTITDAIARKLIAKNPLMKKKFLVLPDGEPATKEVEKVEEVAETEKVAENEVKDEATNEESEEKTEEKESETESEEKTDEPAMDLPKKRGRPAKSK